MNIEKSRILFEAAQQLMPGGVNSPARAFGAVGKHPLVIDRAEGAHLYDVAANQYLDYIGSWAPIILGHGHCHVCQTNNRHYRSMLTSFVPLGSRHD